jgi:nucleoside-diphosphate-sugar epimerase
VVFHTAAKAGIWGTRESYYAINVRATERLVAAARSAGVSRFVYTSSPSVVFERGHDALDASEDKTPYPESYTAFYPETKAHRGAVRAQDERARIRRDRAPSALHLGSR